jgi:hypothetical protein
VAQADAAASVSAGRMPALTIVDEGFAPVSLALDQVTRLQRWAWRPSSFGTLPIYFFDGINFWWQPRPFERVMVSAVVAPGHGWRHRCGCNCGRCAPEPGARPAS